LVFWEVKTKKGEAAKQKHLWGIWLDFTLFIHSLPIHSFCLSISGILQIFGQFLHGTTHIGPGSTFTLVDGNQHSRFGLGGEKSAKL
jgi:hypothetical protein